MAVAAAAVAARDILFTEKVEAYSKLALLLFLLLAGERKVIRAGRRES